jgi:hypothetical protein
MITADTSGIALATGGQWPLLTNAAQHQWRCAGKHSLVDAVRRVARRNPPAKARIAPARQLLDDVSVDFVHHSSDPYRAYRPAAAERAPDVAAETHGRHVLRQPTFSPVRSRSTSGLTGTEAAPLAKSKRPGLLASPRALCGVAAPAALHVALCPPSFQCFFWHTASQ